MCRKLNWWYVHCALGMMRENRLGSPVELQVLPGQVQELQETISNLVLPNALGRGRIEVESLHSLHTHCTGCSYWCGCRPTWLPTSRRCSPRAKSFSMSCRMCRC